MYKADKHIFKHYISTYISKGQIWNSFVFLNVKRLILLPSPRLDFRFPTKDFVAFHLETLLVFHWPFSVCHQIMVHIFHRGKQETSE